MRWQSRAERKSKALQEWHRWFAWYPLNIGGTYVWLERVHRKGTEHNAHDGGTYFTWEYKLEGKL